MELKDIMEFVMEHALEGMVFVLFLGVICALFFGGGLEQIISLMGTGLFGGSV